MFSTLTIAALIATAQTATPAEVGTIAAPASAGSPAPTQPIYSANTRFCVMGEITGSRILRKSCATRDQWLHQGFDPLTAKRAR